MREQWLRFSAGFRDNPSKALLLFIGASIVLWTTQCSLLQNIQSLDTLETVTWGAQWAWGHFKHPPLSGWMGYGFSVLTGHSDWGLYLLAQLCLAVGVWYAYKLAREFWQDQYSAAAAALLLYVLHYYNPSWMKFSSFFVEIALRPVMAYYFYVALRNNRWHQWALFGFFCGLGILAKYSTVLLLAAFLLLFLMRKQYRLKLLSYGPYLAFLIFLLVIAPHINWLIDHDFACFRHVESRMVNQHPWYTPLNVTVTAFYPLLAEMGMLLLACFPRYRGRERKPVDRNALCWALVLTLVPSFFFILISLFGSDVILMWFSSLACWTGIAVVAVFPFAITRDIFRRLFLLLVIYTAVLFVGTSIDLLVCSRPRLHVRPEAIVNPALNFWKSRSGGPVPVVVGERWLSGVIENYSEGRPPACEIDDEVFFDLYKERIAREGALLIARRAREFTGFLKQAGFPEIEFTPVSVEYSAPWGKTRKLRFVLGYLPPRKTAPEE